MNNTHKKPVINKILFRDPELEVLRFGGKRVVEIAEAGPIKRHKNGCEVKAYLSPGGEVLYRVERK